MQCVVEDIVFSHCKFPSASGLQKRPLPVFRYELVALFSAALETAGDKSAVPRYIDASDGTMAGVRVRLLP